MADRESSDDAVLRRYADVTDLVRAASGRQPGEESQTAVPFYRIALGKVPLQLGEVEFRILMLLASKPYRPFSPQYIAANVTTQRLPVSEATVDQYIATLREQLGFFRDYVQTVPHLGYRFKP